MDWSSFLSGVILGCVLGWVSLFAVAIVYGGGKNQS